MPWVLVGLLDVRLLDPSPIAARSFSPSTSTNTSRFKPIQNQNHCDQP